METTKYLKKLGYHKSIDFTKDTKRYTLFEHFAKAMPVVEEIDGDGNRSYAWECQLNCSEQHYEFDSLLKDEDFRKASSGTMYMSYVTPLGDCLKSLMSSRNEILDNPEFNGMFMSNIMQKWKIPASLIATTSGYLDLSKELSEHIQRKYCAPIGSGRITQISSNSLIGDHKDAVQMNLGRQEVFLDKTLIECGYIPKLEENMYVTQGSNIPTRYWHTLNNRIMSYQTENINEAQKLAAEEIALVTLGKKMGVSLWERNSREYDIFRRVSGKFCSTQEAYIGRYSFNKSGEIELRSERNSLIGVFKNEDGLKFSKLEAVLSSDVELL